MHASSKTLWLVLALAALNVGCINISRDYPERSYYMLQAERGGAARPVAGESVLRVLHFRATPTFSRNEFVYRTGETTYSPDFYHAFFVSPGDLMTEQSIRWLTSAGLFKAVVGVYSQSDADYSLEGAVNALYGDFRERNKPCAVMELCFCLLRENRGARELVFCKTYSQSVKMASSSPEALVDGWNVALKKILEELESDLAAQHYNGPLPTGSTTGMVESAAQTVSASNIVSTNGVKLCP